MVKVSVYLRSGALLRVCRLRSAVSLVRQGRAELLANGDYRMCHWTDDEIDQMNQLALIHRSELPAHLKVFYSSWDEMFAEIDDGRRWRGVQSANRTNKGAGYSGISSCPAVMQFT